MAKHVEALKNILKFEEKLLAKLLKTLPLVSEKDTRVLLAEIARSKKGHLKAYKKVIRKGEKDKRQSGKKPLQ